MEKRKEMERYNEYTLGSLYLAMSIWVSQRLQPEAHDCSHSAGNMQHMQTQES